jgi:hypothetical protein
VTDVLNANIDTLLDVAVANLSMEEDTNGRFGDVEDDSGLAMVEFVWHTVRHFMSNYLARENKVYNRVDDPAAILRELNSPLLLSTVDDDIDDITNLQAPVSVLLPSIVRRQVGGHIYSVFSQKGGQSDHSTLLEASCEGIAGTRSETSCSTIPILAFVPFPLSIPTYSPGQGPLFHIVPDLPILSVYRLSRSRMISF